MDRLRDLLPQPRLLSKPLPPEPAYGVPSNFDNTVVTVHFCDAVRDNIGFLAKTQGMFKHHLALEHAIFGLAETYFAGFA